MNWKFYTPNLGEFTISAILSLSWSALIQEFWKESVHGLAVVITSIVGAVALHLVRYWLNKKYPIK